EHDIDNREVMFKLTEEQVLEILASSQKPEDETYWFDIFVKIDLQKRKRFDELCRRHDIGNDNTCCISDTLGIYRIEPMDCFDDDGVRIKGSSLDIMLEEKILTEVYHVNQYDMDDQYDMENNKVCHTKSFDNAPYFIYHQPYWADTCQERMNIPQNPVNISQCNEDVRHRIHKVKGLFREMKHIQIAQFVPCNAYDAGSVRIGSCEYALFPLPNGSQIYSLVNMANYDFLPYCPMREENGCTSCVYRCLSPEDISFTHEPTVLIVLDPRERPCYQWKYSKDVIFKRAICLPYVRRCPVKRRECSYCDSIQMSPSELTNLLSETKGYFESIVKELNPRVIILMQMANTIMSNVFTIYNHRVIINDKEYPIFRYEELKEYHDDITQLALLPYQGKELRVTYTETEMEELIKQGIAKKRS
ncbi:MAG: hypothetical protein ACI4A7_00690, partial [Prevotella sp.]